MQRALMMLDHIPPLRFSDEVFWGTFFSPKDMILLSKTNMQGIKVNVCKSNMIKNSLPYGLGGVVVVDFSMCLLLTSTLVIGSSLFCGWITSTFLPLVVDSSTFKVFFLQTSCCFLPFSFSREHHLSITMTLAVLDCCLILSLGWPTSIAIVFLFLGFTRSTSVGGMLGF